VIAHTGLAALGTHAARASNADRPQAVCRKVGAARVGPIVPAGLTLWPLDRAPEALRGWRDYVAAAAGQLCQLESFS
jgi:hypothetical protein